MTSTLNTIAQDDFYKGIPKLYGRANLCVVRRDVCRKLNNKSVISFTQILFTTPVLKLSRRTVYIAINKKFTVCKLSLTSWMGRTG